MKSNNPNPHSASNVAGVPLNMDSGDLQVLVLPSRYGSVIVRTQVVTRRLPDGSCEKFHLWNAPEPDEMPHNHPWILATSTILKGSLTEERYKRDSDGKCTFLGRHTYVQGDTYELPHEVYHKTVEVAPGTVTHFRTSGWVTMPDNWAYLSSDGSLITPEQSEDFFLALKAANPTFGNGEQWRVLRDSLAISQNPQ